MRAGSVSIAQMIFNVTGSDPQETANAVAEMMPSIVNQNRKQNYQDSRLLFRGYVPISS